MENYAQRQYKKKRKMLAFHNVWAFLLQLLKVICESTLLAFCPSGFFCPDMTLQTSVLEDRRQRFMIHLHQQVLK